MEKTQLMTRDFMSRDVISVHPETPVFEAHALITKHRIDGVPVVDSTNKLVGVLTEYDVLMKDSLLHIPTFQKILSQLHIERQSGSTFDAELKELEKLQVKDVMNAEPLTLPEDSSFEEALSAFRSHHRVNPILVIDTEHRVVGVISRCDILKPLELVRKSRGG